MRCAQPKTGPAFKVAWYFLPENEELSTDAVVCRSNFHCMANLAESRNRIGGSLRHPKRNKNDIILIKVFGYDNGG